MHKQKLYYLLGLSFIFLLSGCVVRSYQLTKDRVDQDLTTGNRGYIQGQLPGGGEKERSATRTTKVVEIELRPLIRFERMKKQETAQPQTEINMEEQQVTEENKGYITKTTGPEMAESMAGATFEKYTVQKGDTLQKISQKFFGTTKKWNKIYEANKDILKGPNKVYVGQVLNIPVSPEAKSLKERKENLK